MDDLRLIRRYNAYYRGWCLAFGDHQADYDEQRDINWLFGSNRVGLILSAELRKQAQREFLGHHEQIPQLGLSADALRMNNLVYPFDTDNERESASRLKTFLFDQEETHMFLCSHFFYLGTRIITFSTEKPTIILYKEMQPLHVVAE